MKDNKTPNKITATHANECMESGEEEKIEGKKRENNQQNYFNCLTNQKQINCTFRISVCNNVESNANEHKCRSYTPAYIV